MQKTLLNKELKTISVEIDHNISSKINIISNLKENGFDKASPKKAPSFLVKFMSLFSREMKGMLPFLDAEISADVNPTKKVFNWEPITFEKTILDSAKSIESLN